METEKKIRDALVEHVAYDIYSLFSTNCIHSKMSLKYRFIDRDNRISPLASSVRTISDRLELHERERW